MNAMQDEGLISDLQRQVKFVLIPAQREKETISARGKMKPGRVIERELSYIADYVYMKDGEKVVEDAKGYRTEIYRIKKKLLLYFYGIRIREV